MLETIFTLAILMFLFWVAYHITGAVLFAIIWVCFRLPLALFILLVGLLLCITVLFIPIGIKCFTLAGKILF